MATKKQTSKNKAVSTTSVDANVNSYSKSNVKLSTLIAEEMDGLTLSFDRIKVPSGGGTAFEISSENSESPDMVKELQAVILFHHPVHAYYTEKYTGGNNPPDCGSVDGHIGIDQETGEVKNCRECEFAQFGSSETGGKACKQRRRIYLLKSDEVLPTLLSLPTGSLGEFSKYIMRLLSKGKKSNSVVTKLTLRKAQNSGGINYSQVVCSVLRDLNADEQVAIDSISAEIKKMAGKVSVLDERIDED